MTNSDKPISFDSLSLTRDNSDTNKPDFRQLDLGSPVSTLRTGPAASSSSSSSGSVSGRTGSGFVTANNSHSGELSAESSPSKSPSPTFSGNVSGSRGLKTGYTRSDSRTGGFLQTHVSGSSVTSPAGNVLPAGNILPAGKVMKTGLMVNRSKPDVLSLGTGNYGHGSIMRGDGGVSKSSNSPNLSNLANSSSVRRSSMDPEELKRLGNESYKKGCYIEALTYYDKAISMVPGNASYHCNRAAVLMCLNRLNEAVKECYEAIKLDNGYIRAHHRLGSLLIR